MMQRTRHHRRMVSLVVAALLLSGCAIKRDTYETPDVPLPADFRHGPPRPAEPVAIDRLLMGWWRAFGSAELDSLVARARASNHDLRMAALEVAQADYEVTSTRAGLFPTVTADIQGGTEAPPNGVGTVRSGEDVTSERTFQAALRMDWTPDLWGETAAATEAQRARLRQSIFSRDIARADATAEVVRTYLTFLSLSDRLRTARDNRDLALEMMNILEDQLRQGGATIIRLAQQEAVLRTAEAVVPELELQQAQALDDLAFLVGTVPADLHLEGGSLADLTLPPLPAGVSPTLLLDRPAVRAAEAEMLAADADIDIARARVLPSLDLTAGYGRGANYLTRLMRPESLIFDALAQLTGTIFDAGRREAAVDRSRARHQLLVQGYIRAVYDAIRETESALAARSHLDNRLIAQGRTADASRRAFEFSREAYGLGAVDYVTALDTERTYQRSLDDLHQTRLALFVAHADLFRALGGGATASEAPPITDPAEAPPLPATVQTGVEPVDEDAVGEDAANEDEAAPAAYFPPVVPMVWAEVDGTWVRIPATDTVPDGDAGLDTDTDADTNGEGQAESEAEAEGEGEAEADADPTSE